MATGFFKKGSFFLLAGLIFSGCAVMPAGVESPASRQTALDRVLEGLFLERDDLQIAVSPESRDPFLTGSTEQALQCPLGALSLGSDIRKTFKTRKHVLEESVRLADRLIDTSGASLPIEKKRIVLDEFQDSRPVIELYSSLAHAHALLMEAFEPLGDNETAFVRETVLQLLFTGPRKAGLSRKASQDRLEKAVALAGAVRVERIVQACRSVAEVLDRMISGSIEIRFLNLPPGTIHTPLGDILIGSRKNDVYEGTMPLLVIDPGGDDVYRFSRASGLNGIIDVSGNDVYTETGTASYGSGMLGLGFLLDMSGDDLYQGGIITLGAGFMGAGILADLDGNDRYLSEAFSQGAAVFGVGLLYDLFGDDLYRGNLYCQGMGYIRGAGILADMTGEDTFVAGRSVPDRREKKGAFQTYSQGFGLGCRSVAAGGAGILYNGAGNDRYAGSYFCQGSAYWQALGVLCDDAGDDVYQARRYAQGAGVHQAAGMLLDGGGNDSYTSWGVSQGCGHDDAVGILRDLAGQDRYQSDWLSQGAGNSRGIGLLVDDGGDDVFWAKNSNVQGAGVYDDRRDALSLGILIDHCGTDRFSTEITAGGLHRNGDVGGALDNTDNRWCALPVVQAPPFVPAGPAVPKVPLLWRGNLAALEQDLFSVQAQQTAAEKLFARGPEIIPLLLNYLEIKDVSVHRAVEEALKKFGRDRIETLLKAVADPAIRPEQTAFLLYVLGDIKNPKTEKKFLNFLSHENNRIKAMALRGLMKLQCCPPPDLCFVLSESPAAGVRKYLARCLAYTAQAEAFQLLGRCLNDDDFNVRYAAGRTLEQRPGEAVMLLGALRQKKMLNKTAEKMAKEIMTLADMDSPQTKGEQDDAKKSE